MNQTDPSRNQCVCKLCFKWNKCQTSNKKLDRIHAQAKNEPYLTEHSFGAGLWMGADQSESGNHSTSAPGKSMHDYACQWCQMRYTFPLLLPLHISAICPPSAFLDC